MKKLVLIIIACILFFMPSKKTFAQNEINFKIQWLIDNKIVEGDKTADGEIDFSLDEGLTRAETAKLICKILDTKNIADELKGVAEPFFDVEFDHWANGYINFLSTENNKVVILRGYPDGKFLPEKKISKEEFFAVLIRSVNSKKNIEKEYDFPDGYLKEAAILNLSDGINLEDLKKPIARKDAFIAVYNALEFLGLNNYNESNFNEIFGVVSKVVGEKFEINQDKDSVFEIDENTIFVGEKRNLQVGSFIKLIPDGDKAKFILELGNPYELSIEKNWEGLTDGVVKSHENIKFKKDITETNEITVENIIAEIDEETLIFVADKSKNQLRKVDAVLDVLNVYKKNRELKDVYMGYDEFQGRTFAKIIVFNKVEKYNARRDLRRVISYPGADFVFGAENYNGEERLLKYKNFEVFPGKLKFEPMDVLLLYYDESTEELVKEPKIMIDYSEDPVFEVVELDERTVTLRDEFGHEWQFVKSFTTQTFLAKDLKVGSHVQILFKPSDFILRFLGLDTDDLESLDMKNFDINSIDFSKIDLSMLLIKDLSPKGIKDAINNFLSEMYLDAVAINIVDKPLEGKLPLGLNISERKGYVDSISKGVHPMQILVSDSEGYRKEAYNVWATDEDFIKHAYELKFEITFDVEEIFGGTKYVKNPRFYLPHNFLSEEYLDKIVDKILRKIAFELGISYEELKEILDSYYEKTEKLPKIRITEFEVERANLPIEIREILKNVINKNH